MKIFFTLLATCIYFISYGQETGYYTANWKDLKITIPENKLDYSLGYTEIIPSLSNINQEPVHTDNYQLMEINLAVDLRSQRSNDNTSILQLPKNKFVQSTYTVLLPTTAPKSNSTITITGGNSRNYSNTINKGGIKNTAYKDASFYTPRYYYPTRRQQRSYY